MHAVTMSKAGAELHVTWSGKQARKVVQSSKEGREEQHTKTCRDSVR